MAHDAKPNFWLHWTGSSRSSLLQWDRRWRLLPASELRRWMNKMRRSVWMAVGVLLFGSLPTAQGWEPNRTAASAVDMLREVQKLYPAVLPVDRTNMVTSRLSGHFRRAGGLSGSDLYLFSDNTYIYTEWTDTLRETIFDKGSWDATNGFIYLTSDKSLPARYGPRDHVYLPTGLSGSDGFFIMSYRWDFSYFLEHAASDPAFMFRLCALSRTENHSAKEERQIKTRLLKKALRKREFYQ